MLRGLTGFVGFIAFLAGLGFLGWSYLSLNSFDLTQASAIQMSEVYTILIYRALLGIGALIVTLICVISYNAPPEPKEG